MGKIFNALQQNHDLPAPALSSFVEECAASAAPAAGASSPSGTAAAAAQPAGIRVLRLRIASPSPLLPFDESHWYAGEQYRIVRTKILQHPARPRMILISSADAGDGKSVSAINLAGALSLKADSRVLLVDGDFRRSSIHSQLGLPRGPGLADVLRGTCSLEQALIRTAEFPNLYVITAGESSVNPTELLDSSRWRETCARIRELFGYAVVDSPPVGRVADYDLLQAACDAVVVVIRPDHTNRKLCFKSLEMIARPKLLGVLLNCVEDWFLSKPHHYQSAYYQQLGDK